MGRKEERTPSLAITLLVEYQRKRTRVQVELVNGEVLEGSVLGMDEHMNITISSPERTVLIPGKSIVSISPADSEPRIKQKPSPE